MPVNQGIKRYGKKAIEATLKECLQLNDKRIFVPRYAKKLNCSEKKVALSLLTMIKEKRDG